MCRVKIELYLQRNMVGIFGTNTGSKADRNEFRNAMAQSRTWAGDDRKQSLFWTETGQGYEFARLSCR